jgi:PEP-CTERM motif
MTIDSPTRPQIGNRGYGAGVLRRFTNFKQEFSYTSMTRTNYMLRNTTFGLFGLLVAAASVNAAPIVTMQQNTLGTGKALDFYYSSTPGAEFLNYRLNVVNDNGPLLLDPTKAATTDQDGDAVDTWMNTVYSLFGFGPASQTFNAYKPTGIGADNPPVARIDWSVFDTGAGDTNHIDAGGGVFLDAPFHLARVMVDPQAMGTATFTAFDTLTLDGTGAAQPTVFQFTYGGEPIIPEPTTFALLGLGLVSGFGFFRRRAA